MRDEPWMLRLWLFACVVLIARFVIGPVVKFLMEGPVQ